MKTDPLWGMIGLARKAGKIAAGAFPAEKAIKKHHAFFVMIAEDASLNTRKQFQDMCSFRNIPCRVYGTKDLLGSSTGLEQRSVLAFTDPSFAEAVMKKLPEI